MGSDSKVQGCALATTWDLRTIYFYITINNLLNQTITILQKQN